MSLSGVDRGTGTHNTSATTFTAVPASNLTAGAMAVMCISSDNANTGGVAFSTFTVTDTKLNTWTRRASPLYDPGAINAGVEGGIFTTPQNGGALTTGDTITVTFNIVTVAKVWTLMEVVGSAGVPTFVTSGVNAGAATAAPTVTTQFVASGDMVIGGCFNEHGTAQTPTGDADTTNGTWSTMQTAEIGTTAAGQTVISQRKVSTLEATQTYNPTLGVSSDVILAWIIITEGSGSNLILFPEEFDNAAWVLDQCTFTVNAIAAPDGTLTAEKFVESADGAPDVHGVEQFITNSRYTLHTVSVFLKAAERTVALVRLYDLDADNNWGQYFNLTTGTSNAAEVGPGIYGALFTISDAENGWWRFSVTGASPGDASGSRLGMKIQSCTGTQTLTYTGDGTSGFYVWGAGLNKGGLMSFESVPFKPKPYNPWLQRGPVLAQ